MSCQLFWVMVKSYAESIYIIFIDSSLSSDFSGGRIVPWSRISKGNTLRKINRLLLQRADCIFIDIQLFLIVGRLYIVYIVHKNYLWQLLYLDFLGLQAFCFVKNEFLSCELTLFSLIATRLLDQTRLYYSHRKNLSTNKLYERTRTLSRKLQGLESSLLAFNDYFYKELTIFLLITVILSRKQTIHIMQLPQEHHSCNFYKNIAELDPSFC